MEVECTTKLKFAPFCSPCFVWHHFLTKSPPPHCSDVVVQIVDARDPLLFRCEDLEQYVREVDPAKVNMLLVSKADLLRPHQRAAWREYFATSAAGLTVAFWSALEEDGERVEGEDESTKLLTSEELVALFHSISPVAKDALTTIGMVRPPLFLGSLANCSLCGRLAIPMSARAPLSTRSFRSRKCQCLLLLGGQSTSRYC